MNKVVLACSGAYSDAEIGCAASVADDDCGSIGVIGKKFCIARVELGFRGVVWAASSTVRGGCSVAISTVRGRAWVLGIMWVGETEKVEIDMFVVTDQYSYPSTTEINKLSSLW